MSKPMTGEQVVAEYRKIEALEAAMRRADRLGPAKHHNRSRALWKAARRRNWVLGNRILESL